MADIPRSVRLEAALADLRVQCPDIEAAAVVSYDGLPMASALPAGMDEERVAAMCAALLSLGERAADGLGRGDLSQVSVEGEHGSVHLVGAQDEAVLVAVTPRSAKSGLVLFELRCVAGDIAAILAPVVGGAIEPDDYAVDRVESYRESVPEAHPVPVLAAVPYLPVAPHTASLPDFDPDNPLDSTARHAAPVEAERPSAEHTYWAAAAEQLARDATAAPASGWS